jgi:L-iditol 2-dehydrogenase
MMAAVLYGKENVRVEEVDIPPIGPDEVLVKVQVALTCGTDVKVYRQGFHARMIVPPAIFGHELAGTICQIGERVEQFEEGMRVVAANSAPCNDCLFCRKDLENLCERLLFNNGAYAEYIRIPGPIVKKNLLVIPEHVSFSDAALVEPLACVLRGLEETGVNRGDTVAVIGLGPIGQMFVRTAKLRGASVIAVGNRAAQIECALKMGADDGIDASQTQDPVAAVKHLSPGGVDVAIEAVGSPLTWQWGTGMVRRGGTVNFFGGCPSGSTVQLDTSLLHYSEITMRATFHHTPYYIRRALQAIACGDIRGEDLITAEAPLRKLPEVFRDLASRNGDLKTAIVPWR